MDLTLKKSNILFICFNFTEIHVSLLIIARYKRNAVAVTRKMHVCVRTNNLTIFLLLHRHKTCCGSSLKLPSHLWFNEEPP